MFKGHTPAPPEVIKVLNKWLDTHKQYPPSEVNGKAGEEREREAQVVERFIIDNI